MSYCRNCGVKSDVGRFCHSCGTKRGEGDLYCYYCGEAGGDRNSAKICVTCNKKAPTGIIDPGPPKRPSDRLQRKRSSSGSMLDAALKAAKSQPQDAEITLEWLAKATGEKNASQVSSWHKILIAERITNIAILKRTIHSAYWNNLVLPIGIKVQIETFVQLTANNEAEEQEEKISDLESPRRPAANNNGGSGTKPKSKTLRQVRGEISISPRGDENAPEISVTPAKPKGKPLPPIPPLKGRKPLTVTIPSSSRSGPSSPQAVTRANTSPVESPRNKSGPSSPRGIITADPASPRAVVIVEPSSPRNNGGNNNVTSAGPRSGPSSPRGEISPRPIDSSTPRAPPPVRADSFKPSRSDSVVSPPPRPPRRLVRTNSEGAATRNKIEAPPVKRRESDAPEMRSAVNSNNSGPVSEPEVKLVKTSFGTSGKSKTLRDKALNLEIQKPVAKSNVGDSIGRILADVTGHNEESQFKAHVSHWEEKPKALDSKKTVTMYSVLVTNGSQHWSVFRRYGQFEKLDSGLKKKGVLLHGDNTLKMLGKPSDPALLRDVLNKYLIYILASPVIQAHHYLHNFLMPVQIGDVKPTQIIQK